MKRLIISLLTLLSCVSAAYAQKQTILTLDLSTSTVKTTNLSIAPMIGLQNGRGDQANIGPVFRTYKNSRIYGFELFAKIQLDKTVLLFIQGCGLTGKQTEKMGENGYPVSTVNDFPRLELSAGLGLKLGSYNLMAGITNEEYDQYTETISNPSFLFKVQKNIKL